MSQHPINELMITAMQNIKEMVDVNTIVGDPVTTPDGMVVMPISKVTFGFASGGGEYESKEVETSNLPFAGGSGAGICISPVAFMVVGQGNIKLMAINSNTSLDKVIDMVPDLITKIKEISSSRNANKDNMGMNK